MAPTRLIAGLTGPLMVAMGIAMLLNRQMFPEMITQVAQNYAIIFLSGALSLLAGVAIVRVHNVWTGGWPRDHHDIGLALDRRRPRPNVVPTQSFGDRRDPLARIRHFFL